MRRGMSRPIDESTVKYGDMFAHSSGVAYMFICWHDDWYRTHPLSGTGSMGRIWVSLPIRADGEPAKMQDTIGINYGNWERVE